MVGSCTEYCFVELGLCCQALTLTDVRGVALPVEQPFEISFDQPLSLI